MNLTKRMRLAKHLWIIAVFTVIPCMYVANRYLGWGTEKSWFAGLFSFGVAVAAVIVFWRARRAIVAANWMCCVKCDYNLSQQKRIEEDPGSVMGPECGTRLDVESTRRRWRQATLHEYPTRDNEKGFWS